MRKRTGCGRGGTCVDHRLSCLREGSLMRCSAQALVTLVKAKLRFSRFPKEPELSRRARSASCSGWHDALRAGRGSYQVGLMPSPPPPYLKPTPSLTTPRASCPQELKGGGPACGVTHSLSHGWAATKTSALPSRACTCTCTCVVCLCVCVCLHACMHMHAHPLAASSCGFPT